jgi:hypothetical protein
MEIPDCSRFDPRNAVVESHKDRPRSCSCKKCCGSMLEMGPDLGFAREWKLRTSDYKPVKQDKSLHT